MPNPAPPNESVVFSTGEGYRTSLAERFGNRSHTIAQLNPDNPAQLSRETNHRHVPNFRYRPEAV